MDTSTLFFLGMPWLQQVLGVFGFLVCGWVAVRTPRSGVWVVYTLLCALWFCIAVRAFILWGILIAGKS